MLSDQEICHKTDTVSSRLHFLRFRATPKISTTTLLQWIVLRISMLLKPVTLTKLNSSSHPKWRTKTWISQKTLNQKVQAKKIVLKIRLLSMDSSHLKLHNLFPKRKINRLKLTSFSSSKKNLSKNKAKTQEFYHFSILSFLSPTKPQAFSTQLKNKRSRNCKKINQIISKTVSSRQTVTFLNQAVSSILPISIRTLPWTTWTRSSNHTNPAKVEWLVLQLRNLIHLQAKSTKIVNS